MLLHPFMSTSSKIYFFNGILTNWLTGMFCAYSHSLRRVVPEMSYRIGSTDISLHVSFFRSRLHQTFAAALLPRSAPAVSIIAVDCTEYNHRGTVESHKCLHDVGLNTTRTITVNEGDMFEGNVRHQIPPTSCHCNL
ncbi:unnamed protein product [Allacma fusca]|uniref:Uncharacterized protein n=1 Tax=Allacma fusca TaxID=39272 RepID=A0A8J2P8H1_9HEXA|nr:unnamed protein product [Allacma fusca]